MSVPAFLTDVLESALDQGIGTPSDVLRHATPDELSRHLPRAEWKQLLTAALGASRTDARLVVDTVSIATICKHVPPNLMWNCVAELGARSLSKPLVAPPPGGRAAATTPPADKGNQGGQGGKKGSASASAKSGGGKKPRPEEDEILVDVADDKKAESVPVDDDQLIDWAQTEEVAAGEAEDRR